MQTNRKRHHVQALTLAAVAVMVSTISMTSASVLCTDLQAYLSPDEAGFVDADTINTNVLPTKNAGKRKICRDPKTGQVRILYDAQQKEKQHVSQEERTKLVQNIIRNTQTEIAAIRDEFSTPEIDLPVLHTSAPVEPASTGGIWSVIHEVARWFGLKY